MKDLEQIQAKEVHIAVLNKRFKTTNYQSGGFIWWNEMEVVYAIKQNYDDRSNLWYCLKMDESTMGIRPCDIPNRLIVSVSHLDFVDIEWKQIKR